MKDVYPENKLKGFVVRLNLLNKTQSDDMIRSVESNQSNQTISDNDGNGKSVSKQPKIRHSKVFPTGSSGVSNFEGSKDQVRIV